MQVISSFLFVNNVFETTDFDGDQISDDIGFIIKDINILNTAEYHNKYFKHETVHAVDGVKYLDMFSQYNPDPLFEPCIEVLLTAQPFKNNILSVSFAPTQLNLWVTNKYVETGICTKSPLNKLIVSYYIDYGDYVPILLTDLALIHEIGHMFGCTHDDVSCPGAVMNSKLVYNRDKSHFTFSNCSRVKMFEALTQSSHCFQPWKLTRHCGNGITEPGEECDCGLSYDCSDENFCCIAHNGKDKPCQIDRKNGFDCVPNQGFCCNKDCQFNDLSTYHLDCKDENLRCPCKNKKSFCTCGHLGICVGNICHSEECVYSGLLECTCPINDLLHCETCCITRSGKCLPLSEIKEVYINESNPILRPLKNVKHINYGNLAHKIWKSNELCLSYGKTGYCERGVCDLAAPTLIMNKMSDAVESLKHYYQEDMRQRSEIRNIKPRQISEMMIHSVDILHEDKNEGSPFQSAYRNCVVCYSCNFCKLVITMIYMYFLLYNIMY